MRKGLCMYASFFSLHWSFFLLDVPKFFILLSYFSLKNFWPVFKGRFASDKFFSFLLFENVFVSFLFLQYNFAIYRICGLQLFLSELKKCTPFGLQNFRWEMYHHLNWYSCIVNIAYLSLCFQYFCLFFFLSLRYALAWISLDLFCWSLLNFLDL